MAYDPYAVGLMISSPHDEAQQMSTINGSNDDMDTDDIETNSSLIGVTRIANKRKRSGGDDDFFLPQKISKRSRDPQKLPPWANIHVPARPPPLCDNAP